MAKHDTNGWASGARSGPVSIGSHSLFLHVSGPDRKASEPVAIIIQGLATSIKAFAAVRRLLSPFIRTYAYERSGFGQSDTSTAKPTSITIAAELDLLLKSANIHPPYILVAHSWGGILAREFIALRPHDVAGLVLIDANQEHTLEVLDWRDPSIRAVAGKLDQFEVTGVRRNHKLTETEWREYQDDESSPKHKKQAAAEWAEYAESFKVLASKQLLNRNPPLLGDWPVCVVMGRNNMDYEMLFMAGVKAGYGTETERASCREILKTWEEKDSRLQLAQLSLSSNSRSVVAEKSGHNVHLTQPEVITDATRWVLGEFMARGTTSAEGLNADRGVEDESRAATVELEKRPPKGLL
jgi:pimeloyl-ACP methyl ester carboxylesterase